MAKIKIKLSDAKASLKLAKLQEAVSQNPQPLFATIGRVLVNRIRLCFKMGIDPWANPWAALKLRKGQPLRDTGRLNRSITSRADADGVTIGTNVMYARTHQFGATIEPKKAKRLVFPGPGGKLIFAKKVVVPARPFLPLKKASGTVALPPDWSAQCVRAIRAYLTNAVSKGA